MSLHSFQRRHPWIMVPSEVLNAITTPERWPFMPEGLARAITRLIAFDTTALGSALRRVNVLGPLRDAVLPRSRGMRSLDWQIRKLFWTFQWCLMVVLQGWPRRAPQPRREQSIRLLSAPETYADFQSPTLVVPENGTSRREISPQPIHGAGRSPAPGHLSGCRQTPGTGARGSAGTASPRLHASLPSRPRDSALASGSRHRVCLE